MFNSIPRCHDAESESESDFYRLHINFCVLRSRKKKRKKFFCGNFGWFIACRLSSSSSSGSAQPIGLSRLPLCRLSLSWTRLMYASPSHRCRGLDKNRRRRSQFMRVAPQSCHSCQLAIAIRGRSVWERECVRSRRRCSNLSRPLNLCHVHALPRRCPSRVRSRRFQFEFQSIIWNHVQAIRNYIAASIIYVICMPMKGREENEEGDLSSFFHLYKARESNNFWHLLFLIVMGGVHCGLCAVVVAAPFRW